MIPGEVFQDGAVYVGETPSGYGLFRKQNSAGGWDYYTDELSMKIYQPTLVADHDILMAMADNMRLCYLEAKERRQGKELGKLYGGI